jgi:1,2-phenylacetyl-CoA epoxidase PaaB subunit
MRFPYLVTEDCLKRYEDTFGNVSQFQAQDRKQDAWFFHAHALIRLANLAYVIEHPLSECRAAFRDSVGAYKELFSLRGTSYSLRTTYKDGVAQPEEKVFSDGYTSVDSFDAAMACLITEDIASARRLVELAGHAPCPEVVSPRSEVCTSNQQTLSYALNAMLADDFELALREAQRVTVRRGNQMEKQIAAILAAIAGERDVLTELDTLLFYHEKLAKRRENWLNSSYYLCLPALGLSSLAIQLGRFKLADLSVDSMYAPWAMLHDA